MTSSTPLNINISSASENSSNSSVDYSEFKDYIIKNNIHLTEENIELRKCIIELEKQNLEQESENDKFDERIIYMRGLMHNLYSLKEMSSSVSNNWKEYTNNYNVFFQKYNKIEISIFKIASIYITHLSLILLVDIVSKNKYIVVFKTLVYNILLMGLFTLIYSKYIPNSLYKVNWCKKYNKFIIKYNEEYYNMQNLQNDLINKTKEMTKEINELEKACVGVSVMIDNV